MELRRLLDAYTWNELLARSSWRDEAILQLLLDEGVIEIPEFLEDEDAEGIEQTN